MGQALDQLDMGQAEFARLTGAGEASVGRWVRGERTPAPLRRKQIRKLLRNRGVEITEEELCRKIR